MERRVFSEMEQKALAALLKLAQSLNRVPHRREVKSDPETMGSSYYDMHFGSIYEALVIAGCSEEILSANNVHDGQKKPIYTLEEVLDISRNWLDKEGSLDTKGLEAAYGYKLSKSVYLYFGGFNKLFVQMGVKDPRVLDFKRARPNKRNRFTDEELIEYLQTFESEHGVLPSEKSLKRLREKANVPSYESFRRRFGTFAKALAAAGINVEPRVYARRFDKQELGEILNKVMAELGRIPMASDLIDRYGGAIMASIHSEYGCLTNALKGSGLAGRRFTDDELVEALRRVSFESFDGFMPTTGKYDKLRKLGEPCAQLIFKRMGGWILAAKKAGLMVDFQNRNTDKVVCGFIDQYLEENNELPTIEVICDATGYSLRIAELKLKKYLPEVSEEELKEKAIRAEVMKLRALRDKLGRDPYHYELGRENGTKSYRWFNRHFGSIQNALEYCGG